MRTADHVILKCIDKFNQCNGELAIEFVNCSAETAEVERLEIQVHKPNTDTKPKSRKDIQQIRRDLVVLDMHSKFFVVPSKTRRIYRHQIHRDDEYALHAGIRVGSDVTGHNLNYVEVRAINPLRDPELVSCYQCRGIWGPQGFSSSESCNCRTKDFGKSCPVGDVCEGTCLFDHYDELPDVPIATATSGEIVYEVLRERPVGRCSEFKSMLGCFSFVPERTYSFSIKFPPGKVQRICVN